MVYMKQITKAEMDILLTIAKSPEIDYNANSLAKAVGITPMGALKILKRLEKESILKSKKIGRIAIYRINLEEQYAQNYVSLLFSREALHSMPNIRRWINEIKKIKNADIAILYGSLLRNENPKDIDVLLITDKKRFARLEEEIRDINKINIKKIHPLYQTFADIVNNIKIRNKPLLNAIKGIVIIGENKFLEVYNESRKE